MSQAKRLFVLYTGKYFCDETVNEIDRKIPTLEEVLEKFSKIPVNIDIKRNDDELIERVSQLISSYNREKTCVWGNISSEITEKCYKRVRFVLLIIYINKKSCA